MKAGPAMGTWIVRLRVVLCDHFSFVENKGEEGQESNFAFENY